MSTLASSSPRLSAAPSLRGAFLKALVDEVTVLAGALLSPGKIIREVEQMSALHAEARRLEAAEPARAAVLRRQASRIGLR